jgi:large subunit ribosomal protein L25
MSDSITLTLKSREVSGKKVAKLRTEGQTPGVIYGHSVKPVSVQAPEVALAKVVASAGKHHLVSLDLDGKKHQGLIKSIDIDPVKNKVRHVAFHIVRQNEKIETSIPVKLIGEGESEAEKAGLVVLQNIDSLAIRSLPKNLPDSLEVDITALADPGQTVTVADIKVPEGVELIEEDTSIMIASVYEPAALAAANDAAGGDAEDESTVEAENGASEDTESNEEEKS